MQDEQPKGGAGSSVPARLEELKAKTDSLGRLFDQLQDARTANRRTRIGVLVVILLVFIGYFILLFGIGKKFYKEDVNEFAAALQTKMMKVVVNGGERLLEIAQEARPIYEKALQEKLKAEWPTIKLTVHNEAVALKDYAETESAKQLEDRIKVMGARQKALVIETFPELDTPGEQDLVLANLQLALQGAVEDTFLDMTETWIARIEKVQEKLQKLKPDLPPEQFREERRKALYDFLMYEMPEIQAQDLLESAP